MYDEQHFTRDAATVSFDADASGITVDDGEASFEWDNVETVTVEQPPHAEAFDSKQFYKLPATVAKPIPQPYSFGEDNLTWLKKPREELKKAAWSLDNAPWTKGHPETGMVKDVSDVEGFWRNPRYIDSVDDLDADLHIPIDNDDAKDFIEENGDVSVGFYNKIARVDEYDGIVGGNDDEDIDIEGFQTNMLFDHVASVEVGRCPSGQGCGIESDSCQFDSELNDGSEGIDSRPHGEVDSFKRGTGTTHKSDDSDGATAGSNGTVSMNTTTDQPSGIKSVDGDWYAVGADEHTKESTDHPDDHMYPVGGCGDVDDAWRLRGHAEDLEISQDTLEQRIIRAAEAQDCTNAPSTLEEEMDEADCECDTDDNTTMELEFDDLSTEAAIAKVESQHDGVSEYLDELREAQDAAAAAEDAAEELDIDDVSNLTDSVAVLKEERDSLQEEVEEAKRPQMEEDASFIAERTDRFGDSAEAVIDNLDADAETVSDKRELVEELTEGYDEQTANPDDERESTDTPSVGYAKTPW